MKIIIPTLILSLTSLFSLSIAQEKTMQNTVVKSPSVATKTPPWETHLISQKDFIEISEKLIRGIKTPEDMTLERIESITGLKFEPNHNGKAMYIYAMRFDNSDEGTFILSAQHTTDKQKIARPRFSLMVDGTQKIVFFNAIKLFKPIIEKLDYKETPNLYPMARDGYEYETGQGKNRLLLQISDHYQYISIEAKESTQDKGWSGW